MWLSIIAVLVGIGFLIRNLEGRGASVNIPNILLSLFALLTAVLFLPNHLPEPSVRAFGWTVTASAALFVCSDLLWNGFQRLKRFLIFRPRFFSRLPNEIKEICTAMERLAATKTGALIVIERKQSLDPYLGTSLRFDAEIKADILMSLFHTSSPVHDGALIIGNGRIKAVRVILPLATRSNVPMGVGTRHRASIGITERTDAVALVVSEERGSMSVVFRGMLVPAKSQEQVSQLVHYALKGKNISAHDNPSTKIDSKKS